MNKFRFDKVLNIVCSNRNCDEGCNDKFKNKNILPEFTISFVPFPNINLNPSVTHCYTTTQKYTSAAN